MKTTISILSCFVAAGATLCAESINVTDASRLKVLAGKAEVTTYKGSTAVKMTEEKSRPGGGIALVKNLRFSDGTIELEVAGTPAKDAAGFARGFIGVCFRAKEDGSKYENFYLRPTNARADDQERRNHTTQYMSAPDWPWERLRKETPSKYESYVDMEPGEWTHMRIVVRGTNALLYVGKAEQPALLVHDLKLGATEGAIALWIGPGTEGYFRDLKVDGAAK